MLTPTMMLRGLFTWSLWTRIRSTGDWEYFHRHRHRHRNARLPVWKRRQMTAMLCLAKSRVQSRVSSSYSFLDSRHSRTCPHPNHTHTLLLRTSRIFCLGFNRNRKLHSPASRHSSCQSGASPRSQARRLLVHSRLRLLSAVTGS
jgi:hypothetical protein